jgi:pimeloyl-ACP methyl ester carboxylesterase
MSNVNRTAPRRAAASQQPSSAQRQPTTGGTDSTPTAKATGWGPKLGLKLPQVFRQGAGPKVDLFNATKDWMSDRVFNSLKPTGPIEQLQGPNRVAYGPLNAPPTLKRPVVLIPGLTMPAQSFDRMGDQLARNPKNGPVVVYVAAQDTFRLGDQQGPQASASDLAKAKIFQVEYRDPWAASTVKAPQVAQAMKRIAQATRQDDLDVVTHSAGGTDFRLYLDQRDPSKGPTINRAVLIGPASHGTVVGNIGAVVGEPVKNVDDAARELAVGSKLVTGLNATWERQQSQVEGGVTIIGTTGTPTLGPEKGLFEDGDGYMPTAQLPMPGARLVLLEGPHKTPLAHLWQVQYSGVVNAAFDVLGK